MAATNNNAQQPPQQQQEEEEAGDYVSMEEGRGNLANTANNPRQEEEMIQTSAEIIDEDQIWSAACTLPDETTLTEELLDLFWELMDFQKRRNWKKKVLTVFMVVSSVLVIIDLLFLGNITSWIESYAAWMTQHIVPGTLLFILILIVCTLIMIPPTIFFFVGGFVFTKVAGDSMAMGIPAAVLASFAGCAIGAMIAFVRARYMMRDLILLFSRRYKIIRAADRAIAHHGFRVMLLLRLCPIVPFNGLNYIGGVTAVTMEEFNLALIGILPLILLTVAAGATAESWVATENDLTVEQMAVRRLLYVAGFLFVLVAVCITVYKAKKELIRELELEREAELAETSERRSKEENEQQQQQPNGGGGSNTATTTSPDDHYHNQPVEVFFADQDTDVNDEEWFWLFA